MKNYTFLFALALVFASSCSAVLSRADGSYSRPSIAPVVGPTRFVIDQRTGRPLIDHRTGRPIVLPGSGRPTMVATGGWTNAQLKSINPNQLAFLVATDAEANRTNAEGVALMEYAQTIGSYNEYIQDMNAVNVMGGELEDLSAKVDAVGRNNIISDCVHNGGKVDACVKDPLSAASASADQASTDTAQGAAPASSATPPTAPSEQPAQAAGTPSVPAVQQPVAPAAPAVPPPAVQPVPAVSAPTSAPAPAMNVGYFLQFKAQVMLAQEPDQLVAAFRNAAAHASTDDARDFLKEQASKVRKADPANFTALKGEYVSGLNDYIPLIE
jgi:hypothetical protein